jgi:hypothetical protein
VDLVLVLIDVDDPLIVRVISLGGWIIKVMAAISISNKVNRNLSVLGNRLIKWKGCHLHSNIFIRLVSCYLCVSYLISSLLTDDSILVKILDCNRDSIREYTSCYEILSYQMFYLFYMFILSEISLL